MNMHNNKIKTEDKIFKLMNLGGGYCFYIQQSPWKFPEKLIAQSSPTLCDPIDCSPPGSSVHGILEARILEWVAVPSSRGSSQPWDQTRVSRITGRFFSIWAPKEALLYPMYFYSYLVIIHDIIYVNEDK